MQRQARRSLIAGAVLGGVVIVAFIAFSLLTPWAVRSLVTSRLARLEERYAVQVDFESLRVVARRAVAFDRLTVVDSKSGSRFSAATVELRVRLPALLRGIVDLNHLRAIGPAVSLQESNFAGRSGGTDFTLSALDVSADEFELRDGTVIDIRAPRLDYRASESGERHELMSARALQVELNAPLRSGRAIAIRDLVADQPQFDLSADEPWRTLSARLGELQRRFGSADSAAVVENVGAGASLSARLPRRSRVNGAVVQLANATVGRFDLQYEHRTEEGMARLQTEGTLRAKGSSAGSWHIDKTLWFDRGVIEGRSRLNAIDLALVGEALGGRPAARLQRGTLDFRLTARPDESSAIAALDGWFRLQGAALLLPRVADALIEAPEVSYRFRAALDPAAELPPPRLYRPLPAGALTVSARSEGRGELIFESGELQLGSLTVSVRPAVRGLGALDRLPQRLELALDLPPTSVRQIIDTVPVELLGPLGRIETAGTLAWSLDFESPTESISRMQWRSDIILDDLELLSIPDEIDVFGLLGPFTHRIIDPSIDYERVVRVPQSRPVSTRWLMENVNLTAEQARHLRARSRAAAGVAPLSLSTAAVPTATTHRFDLGSTAPPDPTYRYVPLSSISPWLVRALLTAEDGDFFHHRGVNWNAVRRAVEYNVEVGEYVFGASTLTMQLAKNLFLSNDRRMARKLQEFLLVMLMEEAAAVPKERQLEIYLNIIEFGPGVFGVYDAAEHYFGKHPRALDIAEALWLASIVPAPKLHYHHFEAGEISDRWFSRMQQLLYGMYRSERLTEEEYQAALRSRPRFAVSTGR